MLKVGRRARPHWRKEVARRAARPAREQASPREDLLDQAAHTQFSPDHGKEAEGQFNVESLRH